MNTSDAIAETKIRTHCGILSSPQDYTNGTRPRKRGGDAPNGGQARRSALQRTARVRVGVSRLRMPVSQRDCAITPRTVMNNAG